MDQQRMDLSAAEADAREIMSLNLDDMTMEQLETRFDLSAFGAAAPCTNHTCEHYYPIYGEEKDQA